MVLENPPLPEAPPLLETVPLPGILLPSGTRRHGWDDAAARAEIWSPPRRRTVVVVPHPDDEALSTGGLIAHQRRAGVEVVVVAVSDGEAAYPGCDPDVLAGRRRREQLVALEVLGVPRAAMVRLAFPDGELIGHVDALTAELDRIVRPGDLVIAPWIGDHHIDHIACGRAAAALTTADVAVLGSLFWAHHYSSPDSEPSDGFLRLELDVELMAAKAASIDAHTSQLPGDAPESVLDDRLLQPARAAFELFAVVR